MSVRALAAMLLAFAVPGAGHLFLGRHKRAFAFFIIVGLMFAIGLLIDGGLYSIKTSGGAALKLLASYASMGSGLLYALAHTLGVRGQVASATFEYGSTFTLTAGLMNLLLILDCFDIANGRKP